MLGPCGVPLHDGRQHVVAEGIHQRAIWEGKVGVSLKEQALQPEVGANCFVEIRIPDAQTHVVREVEKLN